MQDMSCLMSEPANSPPRVLRSDLLQNKSPPETKDKRTRIMPKKTYHNKEVPTALNADKKRHNRGSEEYQEHLCSDSESERHRKSHDRDENRFPCKSCEKTFPSSATLDKHLATHSNEKPFKCKMCDLGFATNGGMLRHARVHKRSNSRSSDSEESSASPKIHESDAATRNSRKRRCENGDESAEESGKKSKTINNNNNLVDEAKLKCTECDREDFASLNVLETHMEESHPDFEIKCVSCELGFKNYRALNLHRYMVHFADQSESVQKKILADSVSGFNDCTFIDFSSQKFPEIAKTVCEQSVHKSVTEQQFRCVRCSRDFPCESALDIHAKSCDPHEKRRDAVSPHSRRSSSEVEESARRDDFFANLDLQNKSPDAKRSTATESIKPKPVADLYPPSKENHRFVDNGKDLADIQSILSVTSTGGLLEQLTQKARENMAKDQEQEEVQDAFAAEFRKMKLRGEFPCRLCTAIFPNLRALKGHNRVHLNGNGAGPYRCNMCPHSSLDKAALVRHMRTHNGDRPYECAVCNYAFTTKANCERHLRNRHSKVTREDVKRSIIYHPSEDPNNDEVNNKLNILREDMKRTQMFASDDRRDEIDRMKNEMPNPISHFPREPTLNFHERGLPISLPRDLSIVIPQPRELLKAQPIEPIPTPPLAEDLLQPRIKVKGFGQLTQIPEYTESDTERDNYSDEEEIDPAEESFTNKTLNYSSEVPMDLSTSECQDDVLDLSKKSRNSSDDKASHDSESETFPQKNMEFNNNHAMAASLLEKTQQMFTNQLLKGVPKIDPATNFYQLSQLYNRGATAFPGLPIPPSFPLNPYFLSHNPFLPPTTPQNIVEMNERLQKEIIRGLQLSGGGLVDPNIMNNIAMAAAKERFQAFHQQALSDMKSQAPNSLVKSEEENNSQQLHINTDTPTTIPYAHAMSSPVAPSPKPLKKETISSQSPNSVKMVIKNGVLMPKQKQRRYRTERPFSCEHCSARFTLRSNMERHIKQQHPQYWSQRQRSSIGNLPRKSPVTLIPKNLMHQGLPLSYDNRLNYMKCIQSGSEASIGSQDDRKTNSPPSPTTPPSLAKSYNMISDQVKYAILAQQLKSQNANSHINDIRNKTENVSNGDNEDEDEEDALVIDEESNDDKTLVSKQINNPSEEPNVKAKKIAQEILENVTGKNDISKDFDWKIAGNLISKNPHNPVSPSSDIPTFVSQMDVDKSKEPKQPDSIQNCKTEDGDLVSVSKLLDNAASQDPFGKYFKNDYAMRNMDISQKENNSLSHCEGSEEDEEGLVASSGSTSEGNNSGSDENRSESETATQAPQKKKSAYSLAPNRVSCPYCHRKFPWSSSLRRHVLTHTGQKPYKCPHCPLLFTTKSNCDRHLLRKHGNSTQQTIQNPTPSPEAPSNVPPTAENGNQSFAVRNVPERPHKCSSCPSSTFSTRSNLRKHMSFKHDINFSDSSPGSPKSDKANSRRESCENERSSSEGEKSPGRNDEFQKADWEAQISSSKSNQAQNHDVPSNTQNSDLPFKCHLCEGSYAERQAALDHIRDSHEAEYELLMSKGALETGMNASSEDMNSTGHRSEGTEEHVGEENMEQLRGKFPDYANRKVVCAFCVRRFWSAEDLRRHMRTHTGERPFSCDVCSRRFTLKHSMLRHRKKHSAVDHRSCEDLSTASGDEDAPSPATLSSSMNSNRTVSPTPNTSTPLSSKHPLSAYQISIHTKNLPTSPEVLGSNVNNNNSPPSQSYESKLKIKPKAIALDRNRYSSEDNEGPEENEVESGGDLIGNLLGISDRGMINKLLSSADEAAKLLGVNNK